MLLLSYMSMSILEEVSMGETKGRNMAWLEDTETQKYQVPTYGGIILHERKVTR